MKRPSENLVLPLLLLFGVLIIVGATNANAGFHGASPVLASGPVHDPTFDSNGVQLPSFTTAGLPSARTGNLVFDSTTNGLVINDGTSNHVIPGLDQANTWTGVQTFGANVAFSGTTFNIGSATAYPATIYANALTGEGATPTITGLSLAGTYNIGGTPTLTAGLNLNGQTLSGAATHTGVVTFNAGIAFNAAGSIAGTSTYIETDGVGGNLIVNAPTGKAVNIEIAGTSVMQALGGSVNFLQNVLPNTDALIQVGSRAFRITGFYSDPNGFNVVHAATDANPSAQLGDGFVKFGPGGATALDLQVSRTSGAFGTAGVTTLQVTPLAANTQGNLIVSPSGTSTISTLELFRTSVTSTNIESLYIGPDTETANAFDITVEARGTGALRPLIVGVSSGAYTESFRIKTDASFQFTTGTISLNAATTIAAQANTANALQITDGTNAYLAIDTRTTTSGVFGLIASTTAPTIASAAGTTFSIFRVAAPTLTLTGTTTVTAINGLQVNIGSSTITDASAVTVTTASTLYIAGAPVAGGSVTITNLYALQVAAGSSYFGGNILTTGTSNNLGSATAYFGNIYVGTLNCQASGSCVALASGATLPAGTFWATGNLQSSMPTTINDYTCIPLSGPNSVAAQGASTCTAIGNNSVQVPAKSVVKNLRVSFTAPGTNANFVVTVVDGSTAEALTCTGSGAAAGCTDTSHSFTASAGDSLLLQVQCTGTAASCAASYISFSVELDQSG